MVLIWAVVWSITGPECLPGGNLFGILCLYFFAVIGGKIFGLIKIGTLPPLPALLGKMPFLLFFLCGCGVLTLRGYLRIRHVWIRNVQTS